MGNPVWTEPPWQLLVAPHGTPASANNSNRKSGSVIWVWTLQPKPAHKNWGAGSLSERSVIVLEIGMATLTKWLHLHVDCKPQKAPVVSENAQETLTCWLVQGWKTTTKQKSYWLWKIWQACQVDGWTPGLHSSKRNLELKKNKSTNKSCSEKRDIQTNIRHPYSWNKNDSKDHKTEGIINTPQLATHILDCMMIGWLAITTKRLEVLASWSCPACKATN